MNDELEEVQQPNCSTVFCFWIEELNGPRLDLDGSTEVHPGYSIPLGRQTKLSLDPMLQPRPNPSIPSTVGLDLNSPAPTTVATIGPERPVSRLDDVPNTYPSRSHQKISATGTKHECLIQTHGKRYIKNADGRSFPGLDATEPSASQDASLPGRICTNQPTQHPCGDSSYPTIRTPRLPRSHTDECEPLLRSTIQDPPQDVVPPKYLDTGGKHGGHGSSPASHAYKAARRENTQQACDAAQPVGVRPLRLEQPTEHEQTDKHWSCLIIEFNQLDELSCNSEITDKL